MMPSRRGFLSSLAVPLAMGAARRPPNVLLLITDDHGYGDLSLHGNTHLRTPHLDSLAKEGAQLTQFQVCPVCSPTRASLMTGRYNYRTGVVDTYLGRSLMHPDEVTLPELLRRAGYRTGIFGKWHLGDNYPLRAMDQGFEEALTLKGGGMGQPSDPPGSSYMNPLLFHNGVLGRHQGYCTDVFADAARAFIGKNRQRPWFAYVATNAPHTPLEVDEAWVKPYREMGLDDTTAKIYAMVSNFDTAVGRLLTTLRELDLERDTIVVFLTDNGPQQRRYNAGMRGLKGSVYQGGIRVPCFVRWPGQIRPGTQVPQPAAHIDLMPTLLAAAGANLPTDRTLDGRNLLPLLREPQTSWAERDLVTQWHRGEVPELFRDCAIRRSRWKLINGKELYDLQADPAEQQDVATAQPDAVKALRQSYERWFADVSNTRGYAPPSIYLGAKQENPVVLTRQDWRGPRAGWTPQSVGHWEVDVQRPGRYTVTVEMAPSAAGTCRLALGTLVREQPFAAGDTTCPFAGVALRKGKGRLEAVLTAGNAQSGATFVNVRRLG